MAHAGVLQKNIELLSTALAPEPHRLQHHVHADLIPVPEAVGKGFFRVVDANRYAIEFVHLDAFVERWPGEPEEARWRVVEARLPRSALDRNVDGVRHLRCQLMKRQRRDETENALRGSRCDNDEVGVCKRLEGRESVEPSSDWRDNASVSHGVERLATDAEAQRIGHAEDATMLAKPFNFALEDSGTHEDILLSNSAYVKTFCLVE